MRPSTAVLLVAVGILGIGSRAIGQDPALPATPQLPAVAPAPPAPVTFDEWLADVRDEARARGISDATLDAALDGLAPEPVVVERDRSQAELVLTLEQYLDRRLTRKMVQTAKDMARRHATLLQKVSARYHIPSSVIVAVWGLESNFGRFSGVRPTIQALATLAYDPRRSDLFREELFDALEILEEGDATAESLKGSWAGAMGQPQFMPSSFLEFAQDFDGDGRRDIWASQPDVFASIANYLKTHGWIPSERWGREVTVRRNALDAIGRAAPLRTEGCQADRQMTVALPLNRWARLGVRAKGGRRLPTSKITASLVSAGPRHFLVYSNYEAILAYNCAHAYGLSVGLLSDRLP